MDGPTEASTYEFEMPQAIVGRLIGRFGSFVNKIKVNTGANIFVKVHPTSPSLKICAVEGVTTEIDEALEMIRERFPESAFPSLTLSRVNDGKQSITVSSISYLPTNNKLGLIEGVINDVTVSNVVSLDHIFVQQPTHPTFPALARMHKILNSVYEDPNVPHLIKPFSPGVVCISKLKDKEWARAEVVAINEEKDEVNVKLVDVGGFVQVPIDDLRQIRVDFVSIPFQATECRLANLVPTEESLGWTEEALADFNLITVGQYLQAHVVGYSIGDSTALVHLYRLNPDQTYTFINEELINHGHARWVEETEVYGRVSYEAESGEEWNGSGPETSDYLLMQGHDRASSEGHDHSSSEGNDHSSIDGNDPLFLEGIDNLSLECMGSTSSGSSQASPSATNHYRRQKAASDGTGDSCSTSSDETGDH